MCGCDYNDSSLLLRLLLDLELLAPFALSLLVLVIELVEEPELVPELGMVDEPELELAVGDLELAVDWLLAELELVASELLVLSVSVG